MTRTLKEIQDATKAARERASMALTPEQVELAAALAEEAEAKAGEAEAAATLRGLDMAARVEAAEVKAGTGYLVAGVDLVALFPAGKAPPVEQLPGGGVIVVRSPPPEAVDELNREVEHKRKPITAILCALLMTSTLDPGPDGPEGVKLRAFAERYPDAAGQAAQKARELGGAKATADKRGR